MKINVNKRYDSVSELERGVKDLNQIQETIKEFDDRGFKIPDNYELTDAYLTNMDNKPSAYLTLICTSLSEGDIDIPRKDLIKITPRPGAIFVEYKGNKQYVIGFKDRK